MRRVAGAAVLVLGAVVTTAPAQAQQRSLVTATDPRGDAYGYTYVDAGHSVDAPAGSPASDPAFDIVGLTAVATSTGVRLTVRLAAPLAPGGEVWVALIPLESDCTLDVMVSDTRMGGASFTGLADWCGAGLTVNSVWRPDAPDARTDAPSAFVPYSAFPQVVPPHGSARVRAESMRDAGGSAMHVARAPLDGVTAGPALRLFGPR